MRSILAFILAIALAAAHSPATRAQTTALSSGQTKAPPQGSAVIAIVGDSLADGLWGGLYKLLQKDKRYTLYRGAKNSVGFTGSDLTDLLEKPFAVGEVHAVVMMIGANDRRSFFADGKAKALLGSPGWMELYRGRVTNFIEAAGKRNVPLVWVLLPIMRDENASRDAGLVNEIVRAAAKDHDHVTLIETNTFTIDESGAYLSHFNDLSGQKRQMRSSDGVHFELAASELIGDLVMKRLREVSQHFKPLSPE